MRSVADKKTLISEKALARWLSYTTHSVRQFEESMAAHDAHLLKMSKGLSRAYAINIFQLNSVSDIDDLCQIFHLLKVKI